MKIRVRGMSASLYLTALFALFIAVAASAQPYLTPYQPPGWSDSLVITTDPNSTTDSSVIFTTNEVYVDWAVINSGNATTTTPFYVDLYTNSVYAMSWVIRNLPAGAVVPAPGINMGKFGAGTNTIELVADATDVYETPPSTHTKTFIVVPALATRPGAPVLISPANGSTNPLTDPTFTWAAVSNAASYEIIVATNAADLPANTNATSGGPSVVIHASVTSTNYTPPFTTPLDTDTTYYWEVNARYSGVGGPWSSTWSYTTATLPPGITILPVWDASITNDPNAATIESTISAACALYQSDFSDPITISVTFQEMNSGLGQSEEFAYGLSYSSYRAALVAAATTPDDLTALAHLPVQTGNPVNNNTNIFVRSTLAWELGIFSGFQGEYGGTISLNTGIMNLSDAQTNPGKYSLFSVTCHEIDEVLGTGSMLNDVKPGAESLADPVDTEDLFRYDASGNRSYTTNINATSYFSLDGKNDLAQFNQVSSGDFGDWYSYYGGVVPQVQDAFFTPGANPRPGVELRVLDVLGYHRVIPPNFVSATRSGNTIHLVWTTASGSSYQLLYSTNLNMSVWNNLGSSITASNFTESYTDTIGPDQHRFYRVEHLSSSAPNIALVRSQVVVTPPIIRETNVLNPYQSQ